jgi:hypothetical protein
MSLLAWRTRLAHSLELALGRLELRIDRYCKS